MSALAIALADGVTVARRNVVKVRRVPELLLSVLVSPLVMVVLFATVFGNAIDVPGATSYREFLVAGTFAMTLTFGSTQTGLGLAEDLGNGIIARFRSLPMAPSAVVLGRTASDVVLNVLSLVVMVGAGLAVGWRVRGSVGDALLALGLLLAFSYALSWVMAWVGLVSGSVEVVNNVSFLVLFPLTFTANTFVPTENLPRALQLAAGWNPVSAVTQAARELFGNVPPGAPEPTSWALQHPVVATVGWVAALLVVFVPLATRQYARSVVRA